uniref:Palmitoyltransferase n=1 Tax=Pyrodinium bahamense TaxID=73915 RepID=A0A7R9ZV38_9DINO
MSTELMRHGASQRGEDSFTLIPSKSRSFDAAKELAAAEGPDTNVDNYSQSPPMEKLPPLPEPDHAERRAQSAGGVCLVLSLVAAFGGVTHAVIKTSKDLPATLQLVSEGLILCEAIVALGCLAGLLCGDSGVIRRSPETCFPLPEEVARQLANGETINLSSNISVGGRGSERTFCVRCFVWRSSRQRAHHCRICQRCVAHFDHHCDIFGRCIAGGAPCLGASTWGNIVYFHGLITMGLAGFFTCLGTTIVAASSGSTLAQYVLTAEALFLCCACCSISM